MGGGQQRENYADHWRGQQRGRGKSEVLLDWTLLGKVCYCSAPPMVVRTWAAAAEKEAVAKDLWRPLPVPCFSPSPWHRTVPPVAKPPPSGEHSTACLQIHHWVQCLGLPSCYGWAVLMCTCHSKDSRGGRGHTATPFRSLSPPQLCYCIPFIFQIHACGLNNNELASCSLHMGSPT